MHIAHNTDHICFDFNSASNICILNVCSSAECIIRCSCSKRACSNCCSKICFFKTARFADVPNSCLDAFGVFKSYFFLVRSMVGRYLLQSNGDSVLLFSTDSFSFGPITVSRSSSMVLLNNISFIMAPFSSTISTKSSDDIIIVHGSSTSIVLII